MQCFFISYINLVNYILTKKKRKRKNNYITKQTKCVFKIINFIFFSFPTCLALIEIIEKKY